MASAVTKFLDKFRAQKKEQVKSAWQQYRDLQDRFVSGEEVDNFEVDTILELIGKTDDDLEKDVANLEERIKTAAKLAHYQGIKDNLPLLASRLETAQRKLNEIAGPLRMEVEQAATSLRMAENESLMLLAFETKLAQTCRDPEILARDAEIAKRLKEIHKERQWIDEQYHKTFESFDYNVRKLEEAQSRFNKGSGAVAKAQSLVNSLLVPGDQLANRELTREMRDLEYQIEQRRDIVTQQRARLAELDHECRALNAEQAELAKRKLIP